MSFYAGHFTDPPRDNFGRAIPDATFQLYLPGTKTAPNYYTDRTKGITVPGDPTSNSFGNVDVYTDPGTYEYWFNGQFIQTVTVDEDNDEDNHDLAAAIATIQAQLALMPTTQQMTDAIAAGGGPTVGAELLANKNTINGYAGLDGSGLVAFAQLPSTLEVTTHKNAANGYIGADSSGLVALAQLPVGKLVGTHVVTKTADYTAAPGDFIVADTTAGTITITLPTPVNDQAPISVLLYGANAVNVSGTILGSAQTVAFSLLDAVHEFVADGSTWYYKGAYFPLSALARLDKDNNFGGHALYNYIDKVVTITGAYTVGADGWGIRIRANNSGGGVVTVPSNAPIGAWAILHQAAAGQWSIATATNATKSEPDNYSKTAKQTAAILLTCIKNDDGLHASWVIGGYTGP